MAKRVDKLISRLKDTYYDVREDAAEALGKIGDPKAVEPLIAALRDRGSDVRKAAAGALNKIDPNWPKTKAAKRQVPESIAALRDEDSGVRKAAVKALNKIDPNWPKTEAAKRQVPESIAALRDEDYYVREAAVKALVQIGKPAVKPLIAALRDENWPVREDAAEALNKIEPNWPKSEAAKSQVPEFIAALSDEKYWVRKAAAEALGKIGDTRAVEPFIAALRDEDSSVRKAAAEALERIPKLQQLIESYPNIICSTHYLRTEKKKIMIGIFKSITYVSCRHCNSFLTLIKDIKQIIGLISGDIEDSRVDGDKFYVNLWNEQEKEARNADIDILEVRNSSNISYDWAINDVVRKLQDPSRPHDYLKKIPVVLRDSPPIPNDAMKTLKKEFREVKCYE